MEYIPTSCSVFSCSVKFSCVHQAYSLYFSREKNRIKRIKHFPVVDQGSTNVFTVLFLHFKATMEAPEQWLKSVQS